MLRGELLGSYQKRRRRRKRQKPKSYAVVHSTYLILGTIGIGRALVTKYLYAGHDMYRTAR